jgi:hypothetical protein
MPEQPIVPQTPLQRVILEQALALAVQLEQAAATAPAGQLLDRCELVALGQGRQFLRDALASALQQQIIDGEKKGRPPGPVPADTNAVTKGTTPATS